MKKFTVSLPNRAKPELPNIWITCWNINRSCVAIKLSMKIILTKGKTQNKIRLQLKNISLEEAIYKTI